MKTLFVTGAEGFTGKHLCETLRKRGYEIVGGVRNRARKLAFEKSCGKALVCDVSDAINVARAIASVRPDGVIHLAGPSQAQAAADEPLMAYQSIDSAWANVLDAVRRSSPRARVLLASTCEVYGNSGANGQPIRETQSLHPVNTFGALKATAEAIAKTYFDNYHLNITIVRPFAYTGAGQGEASYFGSMAQKLVDSGGESWNNSLQVADVDFRRDVLHVQDVVEAYAKLLDEGKPNETYNLCSGRATSVRELVETMIRASGANVKIDPLPSPPEGRVECLCGDNSKLTQLGWKPTRTVEAALGELVQSYKAQRKEIAA